MLIYLLISHAYWVLPSSIQSYKSSMQEVSASSALWTARAWEVPLSHAYLFSSKVSLPLSMVVLTTIKWQCLILLDTLWPRNGKIVIKKFLIKLTLIWASSLKFLWRCSFHRDKDPETVWLKLWSLGMERRIREKFVASRQAVRRQCCIKYQLSMNLPHD